MFPSSFRNEWQRTAKPNWVYSHYIFGLNLREQRDFHLAFDWITPDRTITVLRFGQE